MAPRFFKSLALSLIRRRLRMPEGQIERIIELTHLKTLLEELEVNCILDVGANRGQFAGELRAIGFEGYIISFEPVKHEFAALSRTHAADPKWTGYQVALGSEETTANINVACRTDLSSFLKLKQDESVTECQEVEIKRLDNILPSLIKKVQSPRIFLKMDTQGFDLEVFKGASGCVESLLGLQSELSVRPIYDNMPHYTEALALYEAAGFELYNLSPVARAFGRGLVEMNCFMKRVAGSEKERALSDSVYLTHLAAGL
jgi:FkbM family methyltransferase